MWNNMGCLESVEWNSGNGLMEWNTGMDWDKIFELAYI